MASSGLPSKTTRNIDPFIENKTMKNGTKRNKKIKRAVSLRTD